jgi:RNA polymerase-binding transcription factor DksA
MNFNKMETKEKNTSTAEAPIRARATTQNILGTESRRSRVQPKWARHYQDLTGLRDQILQKRETLAQDANVDSDNRQLGEHMADGATDSYDRDWALSMLSSEQSVLYEIEQALDRISRGTYGICELTGQPIEADRLRAVPWTRFCAAAQKELETNGMVGRTHLAAIGDYYGNQDVQETSDEEEKEPVS